RRSELICSYFVLDRSMPDVTTFWGTGCLGISLLRDYQSEAYALYSGSLALDQAGRRLDAIEWLRQSVATYAKTVDPMAKRAQSQLDLWMEERNA
ncbi:MAG: hypothetical protein OEU92_35000, partial [Alphaproteobacteria bacterium]|nr:hypothetical protein [Alphaproteobacteria bacterium]